MSTDKSARRAYAQNHLQSLVYDCTIWREGCMDSTQIVIVPHHFQFVHAYIEHRIEGRFGDTAELRSVVLRRDW